MGNIGDYIAVRLAQTFILVVFAMGMIDCIRYTIQTFL